MILAFGQFLGREVNRIAVPGFVLTLRRSNSAQRDRAAHSHSTPNILLPLEEGYWSEADGFDDKSPSQLIYTPAGTMHRDSMVRLGGRYLAISVDNWLVQDSQPFIRAPVAIERPGALRIAHRLATSSLAGAASDLFAEDACLNIVSELSAQSGLRRRSRPPWLQSVVEFCNASPHPMPRIQEIAARVGVHPVHVSRVFRTVYGVPLSKYILAIRVERAAAALRKGTSSLAAVSAQAGFADQSHLSKVFKSMMGVTPRAYKALFSR